MPRRHRRTAIALAPVAAIAACLARPRAALAATSLAVEVTPAAARNTPCNHARRGRDQRDVQRGRARRAAADPARARRGDAGRLRDALAGTPSCGQDELELQRPRAPARRAPSSAAAARVRLRRGRPAHPRVDARAQRLPRSRRGRSSSTSAVTQPTTFAVVLPGSLDRAAGAGRPAAEPRPRARSRGSRAAAARSSRGSPSSLARGLAAGPCPWTFAARLDYDGGGSEERTADARCETGPDTTAPVLRASARDGAAARGARLQTRLSEAATVRVTLERRAATRWVRVLRTSFRAAGRDERAAHRARALARAGRYRARLRAVDAAGAAVGQADRRRSRCAERRRVRSRRTMRPRAAFSAMTLLRAALARRRARP